MKKRGFTLIEIIAVLAILALVSIVIANSLVGAIDKRKEESFAAYIDKINTAACAFIEIRQETRQATLEADCSAGNHNCDSKSDCISNNNCQVTVDNLVKMGLIDRNLLNPKTDKKLNEYTNQIATIRWQPEIKVCAVTESNFES